MGCLLAARAYAYIHGHIDANVYADEYVHVHVFVCVCVYRYMCICLCICPLIPVDALAVPNDPCSVCFRPEEQASLIEEEKRKLQQQAHAMRLLELIRQDFYCICRSIHVRIYKYYYVHILMYVCIYT